MMSRHNSVLLVGYCEVVINPQTGRIISVIKGAELKTAKAKGELPKNHQGRKNHHGGSWVYTESVTSNEEASEAQSEELRKNIDNFNNSWTSE
jgi:hypothetical protein